MQIKLVAVVVDKQRRIVIVVLMARIVHTLASVYIHNPLREFSLINCFCRWFESRSISTFWMSVREHGSPFVIICVVSGILV